MSDHTAAAFDPVPGTAIEIADGLRRILAPNPSPMTFRGTNTYLLGASEIGVIDPGPDSPEHLEAILTALPPGGRISHIFVTHAHLDHSALAPRLAAKTGAPVLAFGDALAGRSAMMQRLAERGLERGGEGVDLGFAPDRCLADGETVEGTEWSLRALWTPGHFGNHLCFAWSDAIFTGDLVMGWASSLVSPPYGDAGDFVASCARLEAAGPRMLYPGHGAPVDRPAERLDWLIAHRRGREADILKRLKASSGTAAELARDIYTDTPEALMRAAARNVLAHLIDLTERGFARHDGPLDADAVFHLVDTQAE